MPSPTGTSPFQAFTRPRTARSSGGESGTSSDGSESSRIDRFLSEKLGRKLSVHTQSRRSSFNSKRSQFSQSDENPEEVQQLGSSDEISYLDIIGDTGNGIATSKFNDYNNQGSIDEAKNAKNAQGNNNNNNNPSGELNSKTSNQTQQSIPSAQYFNNSNPNFNVPVKVRPRKNILGRSIYEQLVWTLENDPKWQSQKVLTRTIGFYKIYGEIGAGNFAKVKLGVHQLTREKVAVKIIDRSRVEPKFEKMLQREIATMDSLSHPHLIRLYEVIETSSKVFLISEYAPGGDMYSKVTLVGKLCEHESRSFFRQVLSATTYMHANGIIHRDIKAENVFFSSATTVKVGDFGFSTVARKGQLLTTFCGSPPYAAPELFRDASYEGPMVDIWALGVLLYFMIVGFLPFNGSSIPTLKKAILEGKFYVPEWMSNECLDLLQTIFKQIPCRRPSTFEVIRHPWLRMSSSGLADYPNTMLSSAVSLNSVNSDQSGGYGRGRGSHYSTSIKDDSLIFVRRESTNLVLPLSQATSKSIPSEQQAVSGILPLSEVQALHILHEIGIDSDIIDAHRPRGVRSAVVGIYRMLLKRIEEGRCWSPKEFVVPCSMSKSDSASNLFKSKSGILRVLGKGKNAVTDEKKSCCPPPMKEKSTACFIL